MRELSIACLLATLSFGTLARAQAAADEAPAPSRPFEHAAFEDLVVPDAEPDEQVSLARALAAEGAASLARDELETAARQLEVSYRLEPAVDVLLPLGVALLRLGRHLAAAERLERYLGQDASIATEGRRQAEQALAEARRHFASVTVLTDPPGARLSLDGRLLGASPLAAPLVLPRGGYLLRAQLDGYRDAVEQLVVAGGAPQDLLLRLAAIRAPERRGIAIGLWVTAGLAIASAAVLIPAIVIAVQRTTAYEAQDPLERTGADREAAEAWQTTSFVMAGVTGSAAVSAVTLGLVRTLGGRGDRARGGRR